MVMHMALKGTIIIDASLDESPAFGMNMAGQRRDEWQTLSGIDLPMQPGTFSMNEVGADTSSIADSGQPPYTRGIHSSMYRTRLWTMRQYAGFSSAKETNERFKLLLERGPFHE
jgi:methylmalonyl-CoA mutase N-terminal domain/subunit